MNSRHDSQRGQVLIIFVFAAIALIAITGLAIDGSSVFSDRRHAQNAADTAAMAAALYKVQQVKLGQTGCSDFSQTCGAAVKIRALDLALKNGYPGSEVEVHIPPANGPYSQASYSNPHPDDYVQVIINSSVDTFFARVLGIGTLYNRVEAVALAKYRASESLYGGNTLSALQPTGCGTFSITGTAELTLDNGANIFVNSDSTTCGAFVVQHCGLLTINPTNDPVGVVGSSSVPTCTPPDQTTNTETVSPVQFPPDPLFPTPSVCSDPVNSSGGTWNNTDHTYHFSPGHYTSLTLPQNKPSTFDPGVYCVDSVIKGTGNNSEHYGTGVFFWFRPGGYFEWEGGITILSAPDDTTIPLAPDTAPYKGYLMYVDWNSTITPGSMTCKINGNGISNYTGTIFAPFCHMQLNGTSAAGGWHTQIIGYNFLVNGTTNLMFDHTGTPAATAPEINWTGLYH